MADTVPVTLELPARVWWKLASIADDLDTSVAALLASAALDESKRRAQHAPRTSTRSRVAKMLAEGKTVRQISIELHCSPANVYQHRKAIESERFAA